MGLVIFWISASVVLLTLFGLLWSPVAALSCGLIAWVRGLDAKHYAVAGAKFSICLVLPWVYLLTRMVFGSPLPAIIVFTIYVLLYANWLINYIVYSNIATMLGVFVDIFWIHEIPRGPAVFILLLLIVILPINVYTFWWSLSRLRYRYTTDKRHHHESWGAEIHSAYLVPFVGLIGLSFVMFFVNLVFGAAALSRM